MQKKQQYELEGDETWRWIRRGALKMQVHVEKRRMFEIRYSEQTRRATTVARVTLQSNSGEVGSYGVMSTRCRLKSFQVNVISSSFTAPLDAPHLCFVIMKVSQRLQNRTEQNFITTSKILMAGCQNSQHGHLCWLPIMT